MWLFHFQALHFSQVTPHNYGATRILIPLLFLQPSATGTATSPLYTSGCSAHASNLTAPLTALWCFCFKRDLTSKETTGKQPQVCLHWSHSNNWTAGLWLLFHSGHLYICRLHSLQTAAKPSVHQGGPQPYALCAWHICFLPVVQVHISGCSTSRWAQPAAFTP